MELVENEMYSALRSSIRSLLGSDGHEVELASLLTMVSSDPDLARIADQETAPRSARFDIRLEGQSVEVHRTTARPFGQFIIELSDAVKATVKNLSGATRLGDELLVEPGTGSVRATFIAPPRTRSNAMPSGEAPDEIWPEEDLYSEALRRVAVVFGKADPDSPDTAGLDSALAAIPAESRPALRKALEQAHKQAWFISGTFRQRGIGTTQVQVPPSGVNYLKERLSERFESSERWTVSGYLDGHTWSSGTMRFIVGSTGHSITASFGSSEVQLRVGELDAQPSTKVKAVFTVVITTGRSLAVPRRSYVLDTVAPISDEAQLLFDADGQRTDIGVGVRSS